MFWFVVIVLIAIVCGGAIGLAVGIKLLKFGEDSVKQKATIRIVMISFVEMMFGGFALAAVSTRVVDPLVGLIVTFAVLLLTLLGYRSIGS